MPTIDQLAPATAAADTDEFVVEQAGVTRSVTRAQVLAGVQPQLSLRSGSLLGRTTAGNGAPEVISVGANLSLVGGTLSASATPYQIGALQQGTVPASGDLVPLSQVGTNTAVTYAQFLSGLSGISGIDVSKFVVTATGTQIATRLADFAASTLPISGGSLTGPLTLSASPVTPQQAATKGYVDGQVGGALPKSGGTMTGALILAGDPSTGLQSATKSYVDAQAAAALIKSGGTLLGSLTLAADPVQALQAATKQYVDARVIRSGDTLTGPLSLSADPVSALQATTKQYVDAQVATALSKTGGALTGPLTLSGDPSSPTQAATKRYVDGAVATALPISGGALTGPVSLAGNPATALQPATKQYVDSQLAAALPLVGGTLSGSLTLAGAPTSALQAATKQYVDTSPGAAGVINVRSPPFNAQLNGSSDDTAAFVAAYQAATAGSAIYVPFGVAKLQNPNSWGVPLTKWVKWVVDGTTLSNGTALGDAIPGGSGPSSFVLPGLVVGHSSISQEVSQGSSGPSDFALLRSAYIVNHNGGTTGSVSTNARTDTIIYNSPNNYIWGGLDRLLWCGTQTPSASTPAQHVARYLQTVRQAVGTDAGGKALPQPQLWSACLEFRDTTGQPSSATNAGITVEMDWYGNGPDDAKKRTIQSLVVGQHNPTGAPVEVSTIIGVYLGAGSSGHATTVFAVGIPFSSAVLDTTNAQQMSGASAIRLAAGHAIAFEATNSNKLAYDSATNTLRWNQGSLSYPVGKGISVGSQNVYGSSATLPNYITGNIIFLVGTSTYTITLPPVSAVAAGTGYTFSVIAPGTVTIAPATGDSIDNGPITLYLNDRYHIVSDGGSTWREVFRTNAISPHYLGPPALPAYTVATLPPVPTGGAIAYVKNGRKPGEPSGGGTGVEVFGDGSRWISVCSGTQVLA